MRAGMRLGAWWGAGHAATLVAVGVPLILLQSALPAWLESGAQKAIGVVIALLGLRLVWNWRRSRTRVTRHMHPPVPPHRHAHPAAHPRDHAHDGRTPLQALAIGALHGLVGTGAIVLLLIAAIPGTSVTMLALCLFAVMSVLSMTLCTGCFAWLLTRPPLQRTAARALTPALGLFAVLLGTTYAGM